MFRSVSVFLRKKEKKKKEKKLFETFVEWKKEQHDLKTPERKEKKLLIIRLDDIGDYLLFRNSLGLYKKNNRWKAYSITLLGNEVWKDLFEKTDKKTVDENIWINKKKYFEDKKYRLTLWKELNNAGFETVICPSRTRPLLLDDLFMLACRAQKNIACENTLEFDSLNKLSDSFYTSLFTDENYFVHEFFFNFHFANWCCNTNIFLKKPELVIDPVEKKLFQNYILCFIGASAQSKRWPVKRWIELIRLLNKNTQCKIFIAGSKNEFDAAEKICKEVNAENIAAKFSLTKMADFTSNAKAVITCDSMGLHLSASLNISVIVIANGNNAYRFTDYKKAGIENVETIYPEIFMNNFEKYGNEIFKDHIAVTADIATIKAEKVFQLFIKLTKKS